MGQLNSLDTEAQARLVRLLADPALHDRACNEVRVIETHSSYVLLSGSYAYKIKKCVNLGFLDFTTLAARRFYCDREIELNRRLAPAVYLEVVPITGSPDAPRIGGDGPAIEYAVKMREFPQDALLPRVLERGALTRAHVDSLAATVAGFHMSAPRARPDSRFGAPDRILTLALENFREIAPLLACNADRRECDGLRVWTERAHARLAAEMAARKRAGFVRACHGDLHLGNMALIDGRVTIFDCIEFNEDMRWSDVMADVAFVAMDLRDRGRPDLASHFVNAYLESTGDYEGVELLRFYIVYRAMVRAKITCIRASQTTNSNTRDASTREYRGYLALARQCAQPAASAVLITHGLSGSGKTTGSLELLQEIDAIRIRTDVERKRLHGLAAPASSDSTLTGGIYTATATDRTYDHISRLARVVACADYPVIVDGTFLERRRRDQFRSLAGDLGVPFVILDFASDPDTLRARVRTRHRTAADASEAGIDVLEHQLRVAEPLGATERADVVTIDTSSTAATGTRLDRWQPVVDQLLIHV